MKTEKTWKDLMFRDFKHTMIILALLSGFWSVINIYTHYTTNIWLGESTLSVIGFTILGTVMIFIIPTFIIVVLYHYIIGRLKK